MNLKSGFAAKVAFKKAFFSFCCVDDVDSKGVHCLLSPLWWQEVNWTDTNRLPSQASVNTTPADPSTKMLTQVDSSFSAPRCFCLLMLSLPAALTAPKNAGAPQMPPRATLNTSHVIDITWPCFGKGCFPPSHSLFCVVHFSAGWSKGPPTDCRPSEHILHKHSADGEEDREGTETTNTAVHTFPSALP